MSVQAAVPVPSNLHLFGLVSAGACWVMRCGPTAVTSGTVF